MGFIDGIKEKARALQKTIVLPETEDDRIFRAAEIILKEQIAKVVLIGDTDASIRIVLENCCHIV